MSNLYVFAGQANIALFVFVKHEGFILEVLSIYKITLSAWYRILQLCINIGGYYQHNKMRK
jgi:hypothetical protein